MFQLATSYLTTTDAMSWFLFLNHVIMTHSMKRCRFVSEIIGMTLRKHLRRGQKIPKWTENCPTHYQKVERKWGPIVFEKKMSQEKLLE